MAKHDLSTHHFQRKISDFCEVRIAPIASQRVVESIRLYLIGLVIHRRPPPIVSGRMDWTAIGEACGIENQLTPELKKALRPVLDAIIRWLGEPPAADDLKSTKTRNIARRKAETATRSRPRQILSDKTPATSSSVPRGPQPKPISPFPEPLFEATDDPASFSDALVYHMRRFGESYWQLYRAVVRLGETFDDKTLLSWVQGERVPRSLTSFEILSRIERRYRLGQGYFKAKLPHQSRSLYGHDMGDISAAERRRLAWHLPDNFSSLPFSKREEIIEWVRRVIISGSTDYRRYQAAATKQRYAIRFPGITCGGGTMSPRPQMNPDSASHNPEAFEDPDLLSGVVDAPPRLAMEMADLIRFKTSTLTAIGFQRNGVWGEETASQKVEHLGLRHRKVNGTWSLVGDEEV